MAQLVTYVDASDHPDDRVDFPEVIADLEQVGFTRIGRIAIDMGMAEAEEMANAYTPEDRAEFLEHFDIPMPVLVSRDGTAYADVSWWWGGPAVRIRTELADGSLAETMRTWDHKPGLPGVLRFLWRRFDIEKEMLRASVPAKGRSTRIRTGPDMTALWATHREHVADYSSQRGSVPAKHADLAKYIRIATDTVGHEERVMRLVSKLWIGLTLLWGLLSIGAVVALAVLGYRSTALYAAIAGIILTPVVIYLVASRVRWLPQSWRPPYQAEDGPGG